MIKKIIVNGTHAEKLTAALDEVQKGCKARTLTADAVEEILNQTTRKLDIPKTAMQGITLIYTGAEHFPNSYKYRPESTHFEAVHNGRQWMIIRIFRATCPNRNDNTSLLLTDAAQKAIIQKMSSFRS